MLGISESVLIVQQSAVRALYNRPGTVHRPVFQG